MANEVELIPSLELPGVEATLVRVEQYTAQLAPLKAKAQSMEVKDRDSYTELGQVLTDVRLLRKNGKAEFSPLELVVDRVKTFLRTKRQKHENACEEIEGIILGKLKPYERSEAEAAAKEQAQLNKKSEVPVTVKPNTPPIAGYRKTTTYRAVVEDVARFLRAAKERKELRTYIVLDEQALGAKAREMKDVAAFEKRFPGVKCVKE